MINPPSTGVLAALLFVSGLTFIILAATNDWNHRGYYRLTHTHRVNRDEDYTWAIKWLVPIPTFCSFLYYFTSFFGQIGSGGFMNRMWDDNKNRLLWIEQSIGGSALIWVVAQAAGVTDILLLAALCAVVMHYNMMSALFESSSDEGVKKALALSAQFAFAFKWFVIGIAYFTTIFESPHGGNGAAAYSQVAIAALISIIQHLYISGRNFEVASPDAKTTELWMGATEIAKRTAVMWLFWGYFFYTKDQVNDYGV